MIFRRRIWKEGTAPNAGCAKFMYLTNRLRMTVVFCAHLLIFFGNLGGLLPNYRDKTQSFELLDLERSLALVMVYRMVRVCVAFSRGESGNFSQ